MTLGLVSNTLRSWAFNLGIEFSRVDYLIDLKPADITSIDSYHDAWFDITSSCHNSSDGDEGPDLEGLDLPHLLDMLFGVGSVHKE